MKISETLQQARDLITKPENWIQEYYARDKNNEVVDAKDLKAVKWCAIGALDCCIVRQSAHRAFAYLADSMDCPVNQFNDRSTHAAVLAAFDKAILAAKNDAD